MYRLESIKERMDRYKSEYLPYFNNNGEMHEWAEMFGDMQYLLQRLERYENALINVDLALENAEMYADEYMRRDMSRNLKAARGNLKKALKE